MIFFGASLNAIPWCFAPEILPLKARSKGTSLAVMVNWIFVCHRHVADWPRLSAGGVELTPLQVFVIVMVTPTMINNIAWKTYLVFMACVSHPTSHSEH